MVCDKRSLPPHSKALPDSHDSPAGLCISILEQINFEKVYLLCKDLLVNPCHEMLVGGLGSPLSKHFKVKML